MNTKNASTGGCPVHGSNTNFQKRSNKDWWPNRLNLAILHQHNQQVSPMDPEFSYANAFKTLDLHKLKKDLYALMTDSQDWWPADYGHYGPLFIRMAWHSAGTYRTADGRGGARSGSQRFAPLNSWPDNGNLDKARRLLWPIKKKYGNAISWADLMILAGNCALESMGFKTFGFGGGREDVFAPEEDIFWGAEDEWLATSDKKNSRYFGDRELETPLAAVQMGLIYVNPEGPDGNPDPIASGRDIRETFRRMGMDDFDTVALTAGGHTFGKAHGAGAPDLVGPAPEAAPIEAMGFGWANRHRSGKGKDTTTSGIEGPWTANPISWDHGYFAVLFGYEWALTKSPSGAHIWYAVDLKKEDHAPEVDGSDARVPLMMTTADMAMRMDPGFGPISHYFHENPSEFEDAFARAWFKLTHRDMGPKSLYLGAEVPLEDLIWQDPLPPIQHPIVDDLDIEKLKSMILEKGLNTTELVKTAWASASTFRVSDRRGGANGGRVRLSPQIDWEVNDRKELMKVITVLEKVQGDFNSGAKGGKRISLADLIILGGAVAIEKASGEHVPFTPGRVDALAEHTDVENFAYLEPHADGFRNFQKTQYKVPAEELLVDRAQLLGLSAPEMTVLVGGLRVLGANSGGNKNGIFTKDVGTLSQDFFKEVLSAEMVWDLSDEKNQFFIGRERKSGKAIWSASRVDLIFGSNSELRAIAEVYAQDDNEQKFKRDFIKAWNKVMNADRFDLMA